MADDQRTVLTLVRSSASHWRVTMFVGPQPPRDLMYDDLPNDESVSLSVLVDDVETFQVSEAEVAALDRAMKLLTDRRTKLVDEQRQAASRNQ
jgi:hypothetical protein